MGTTDTFQAMSEALESYTSSRFDTAITKLNMILKTDLMQSERLTALQLLSNCFTSQGNFSGALKQHEHILELEPNNYLSLFSVATIHRDLQNYPLSILYFKKILDFEPNNESVKYNLSLSLSDYANQLKFAGKVKESEEIYKESIGYYAQNPQSYYNLGCLYSENKLWTEAERCYHAAIQYNPNHLEAISNIGVLYKIRGNNFKSVEFYQRALRLNPNIPMLKTNMAIALNDCGVDHKREGKWKDAVKMFKRALFYFPEYSDCYYNLGLAYAEVEKFEKAVYYYHMCVNFNPKSAPAFNNLGVLYKRLDNVVQAIECYKTAIKLNGMLVETMNNLAVLYSMQGNVDESIEYIRKAIQIDPKYAEAYNNYGVVLRDEGKVDEAIAQFDNCLEIDPNSRNAGQNRLLALNFKYGRWGDEHQKWGDNFQKLYRQISSWNNTKDPNRKIRIGYLSPDFFTHSVSYFIEAPLVFAGKDIEIFCYSNTMHSDQKTLYFQSLGHNWRNIQMMPAEEICSIIQNDKIDILVELAGHSANNKLEVMAMKPAPIQVTWIGYPNTTGLSTIDYRIVDEYTDPLEMNQTNSEKLIRLKHFLCYTPGNNIVEVSPPPYFKNDYITFGTFNNMAKITPQVIACWVRIMKLVEGSRLVLKSKSFCVDRVRKEFLSQFQENGIDSSRIILLNLINGHQAHLTAYSFIDIQLDVFPYAGTTTSCEGIFMGVPMITLQGNSHAHNVGVSLLQAMDYPELITRDDDEYVGKAVELAKDPERLLNYRREMRPKMLKSDLCNGKKFCVQLEQVYRQIWTKYCFDQ